MAEVGQGDATQDFVSDRVTVGVVDVFEAVEIGHENAKNAAFACRACKLVAENVEDRDLFQRPVNGSRQSLDHAVPRAR